MLLLGYICLREGIRSCHLGMVDFYLVATYTPIMSRICWFIFQLENCINIFYGLLSVYGLNIFYCTVRTMEQRQMGKKHVNEKSIYWPYCGLFCDTLGYCLLSFDWSGFVPTILLGGHGFNTWVSPEKTIGRGSLTMVLNHVM